MVAGSGVSPHRPPPHPLVPSRFRGPLANIWKYPKRRPPKLIPLEGFLRVSAQPQRGNPPSALTPNAADPCHGVQPSG